MAQVGESRDRILMNIVPTQSNIFLEKMIRAEKCFKAKTRIRIRASVPEIFSKELSSCEKFWEGAPSQPSFPTLSAVMQNA